MSKEDFGVILFIVLIVAFIAYITAAAMRDKRKRLPAAEEEADEFLPAPQAPELLAQGFCLSCMTKLSGGEIVCPACGKAVTAEGTPGLLPAGTMLAGRYLTGFALGESGSSVTYVGRDLRLETRVRVREYFPREMAARDESTGRVTAGGDNAAPFEQGKAAFLREARKTALLKDDPSAATDLFETNGTAFAVLPYTEEQPLTDWLKRNGAVSPEYALALFAPVLRQLEREEARGLLRCHLSPESFSVCDGSLLLTGTGAPGGRVPAFLKAGYAPEELYRKSGEPGPWTDVYSVCAVIYRCLTGQPPEEASDRVYRDGLRSPSAMGVYLTAAFEEALMKGLSIYREDRFPDCAALFEAIYRNRNAAAGQDSFYSPIIDPVGEADDGRDGFEPLFRQPEDHDVGAVPK